jgi:Phosphodiester glycosidase
MKTVGRTALGSGRMGNSPPVESLRIAACRAIALRIQRLIIWHAFLWVWLPLSFALSAAASTNETFRPDHGCRYTNVVVEDVPWSIHIVEIERGRPDFEFCTTLGKGDVIGMGTVSEQVKSLSRGHGQPLAAINGDFYEKKEKVEGRPRDLQIRFGEVISGPAGHTCFWMAPDGTPHMTNVFSLFRVIWANGQTTSVGLNQIREDNSAVLYTSAYGASTRTAGGLELVLERGTNSVWLPLQVGRQYATSVRAMRTAGNTELTTEAVVLSLGPELTAHVPSIQPGATLQIVTETMPNLTGVNVAIGGGPTLVEGGKPMQWPGFLKMRHPRAALGWNKDHIFLVEVDGRQGNISIGMTFPELANYMAKLGCEQAMNFDGGGSATLWAFGKVRNSPSEGEERPAPNALVVLKKATPPP